MDHVGRWLEGLGLGQYAAAFAENDIDRDVLPDLTDRDLEKLGLSLGHRKRLLRAIAALPAEGMAMVAEAPRSPVPVPISRGAERRQLTVMFADLVGSTELAARLDPEDLGGVIRAYQERCAGAVARWGGHVGKYLGDGVLAYFGWPQAHEDAAERAVRAGLELVEAVGGLRAGDGGLPLAARVGIATGLVMVGDLIGAGTAAHEEAVVGETPNLAARLQALAAPGAVVVAPGTHRLLGGLFDLADLGAHALKGFAAPVRAWRVLGPSAAEGRFEAHHMATGVAPLVGREEELALLLGRWARAKEGEGQVVLLSGEPGIGKSRLVRALRDRLADGGEPHTPLSHFCSPYHTNSALHPVVDLLERAAGLRRDEPPARQLDRLEALLARGTKDVLVVAPLLADLLAISIEGRYPPRPDLSPQRKKELTLRALADQLAGLAAERPVLALWEDAHWIDPTSLELLGLVVERVRGLRALVVVTCRPEFDPPPWAGHGHVTALSLARLGRREGAALVGRASGGTSLPPEVVEQILARADGVPLFVEELTKAVLESGLSAEGDGGVRATSSAGLPAAAIPATLHDSLLARLDRLGPAKEAAQIGAAIGREFSHELIAAVAPPGEAALRSALDRLVASELVFRRGVPPAASYVFKHALVSDAAYATLLKSRRQRLHARIARALDERWPETRANRPELLAHHYTEAGLIERAVPLWLEAGEEALGRSAVAEAVAHLGRGLELIPRLPASGDRDHVELELRVALGTAQMAHKGWPAAEVRSALEPARGLCRRLGETDRLVSVLWGLWGNAAVAADHPRALRVADEMTAEAAGDSRLEVMGHCAAALSCEWTGRCLEARELTGKVLELYDPARHEALVRLTNHDPKCTTLQSASRTLWTLGYPDQAAGAFEEQLAHARRLGHKFNLCFGLAFGASVFAFRREPARHLAYLDEGMALAAEQGFSPLLATGSLWRAFAEYELGRFEDALTHLRSGLASWGGPSDRLNKPYRLALLARCLGRLGRLEEALVHIEDALHRAQRTDEGAHLAELWRIKGELLLMPPGRADEAGAESCFARSLAVAGTQQARGWELRAATSLARLWRDRGKCSEARDLLAPVYGWFTEGFDTQDLKDAMALLDQLAQDCQVLEPG